jgi:hypothetical protein
LDNTVVGNYDSTNFQIRKYVAEWNAEMVDYIKDNLKHYSHPIGAHYTGTPMWTHGQTCANDNFDYSWMYPSIDFIGYSSYDQATDRYAKWTSSDWGKFGCGNEFIPPGYSFVYKPVFHLEQGPGGIFNDEDYTFFEKDLWCNGFSGFASSGFPWGRRNYEPSWNMFGNVRQFFETEVFPLGGFTEGLHWYPGRSLSNESDTERLEAVYLRYDDSGHQKAVGIVMNRLWNPATTISTANTLIWNGDPQVDDTPLDQWDDLLDHYGYYQSDDDVNYTIYYSLDYSDSDEPKIDDMGTLGGYTIKYYNPYTLGVIGATNEVSGPFGELRLSEVPMLNFTLPYVLFKIERNSDVNMLAVSTGTEHSNERNTDNIIESEVGVNESNQSSQGACTCQFYPNPVENFLQINCSMVNYAIEIVDAEGRRFSQGSASRKTIDFENLSAGVYTIKVITETCVIIRKIVKI